MLRIRINSNETWHNNTKLHLPVNYRNERWQAEHCFFMRFFEIDFSKYIGRISEHAHLPKSVISRYDNLMSRHYLQDLPLAAPYGYMALTDSSDTEISYVFHIGFFLLFLMVWTKNCSYNQNSTRKTACSSHPAKVGVIHRLPSFVSGKYNTLDFPTQSRVPTGMPAPLLETQR